MQIKKTCLCQDSVVNANADEKMYLCPDGGANASKENMFVSGWCCVCR